MTEIKFPFNIGSRKKIKKIKNDSKCPLFESPSHYWTSSQNQFLHSKGSANVELSIDPFNKALIRIFCQSIDPMVNYKSIEYCAKTTVEQIIEKMIRVLRTNRDSTELILCESVGRCMVLNADGSYDKKVARNGEPCAFLEQNRRVLMASDYILTVLNYWKPMIGFSRRFELCNAEKHNQMSSCEAMTDEQMSVSHLNSSAHFNRHGSLSSVSQKSFAEFEDIATQTDFPTIPPIAPRRKMSVKTVQFPHLLTLKGEEDTNQSIMIPLNDFVEFGGPGSTAEICLKKLTKYEKQIICVLSKDGVQRQSNGHGDYKIYFDNVCSAYDLNVTVNGVITKDKVVLLPGDIINIGDFYSFFFKDNSIVPDNLIKINNYLNGPKINQDEQNKSSNGVYSETSDHAVTSSSISSCSDINVQTTKKSRYRKKVSIDLNGITLACFDTALNQIIIHYFNDKMDLDYAVGFALYLIRFCRESARCSFTVDDMHERMTKRYCKTLENAFNDDNYLIGNLKLTAFCFQIWMVYHNENYVEVTEENRLWLNYLEAYSSDSFNSLANYICDTSRTMSLCFFDENPFVNIDQHQRYEEEDSYTMDKFLDFLNSIYDKISKVGCVKTVEILKSVITSRIVIALTESTVTCLLSDMGSFTWNKGIQISSQLEKFEDWLKSEGQFNIYTADGFLQDFSKLVSTRSTVLEEMDWISLRRNYKKIPESVLRQFLSGLAKEDNGVIIKWQPIATELFESSRDVSAVLSEYFRSSETCTLFQPAISLQTDCIFVDKIIQSSEFISLCTVLDTELIGMAENFQWMALPKPQSLLNFKNSRWMAFKQPSVENKKESFTPSLVTRNIFSSEKKPPRRKLQTDSDYSSSSYKGETIIPSKKLIARYLLHKSNMNIQSKSLVSLNEQDNKPNPPRRKKYKGSITSLSPVFPVTKSEPYVSNNSVKSRGSISGKSCTARIGRSTSFGSDLSPPKVVVDVDIDDSSLNNISDVDRTIEEMELELRSTDPTNKLARLNLNSSLTPSIENGFYDDDDDEDQMSVGLSAAEMTKRLRGQSKSSDALVEIDDAKTVEVTLNKSKNENYGITITDGMQTNLKKEGIFIFKIARNSTAYRSGKIRPGDQILSINNYSVDQLNFAECLMLMTKSLTSLKLLIEKSDLHTTMKMMSIYQ